MRHAIFIRSNPSNIKGAPLKPKKLFLLITVFFCLLASSVNAGLWGESIDTVDLNDQRTFASPNYSPAYSEGGLGGYWPHSFSIEWDVTQDLNTMLWTYEYTLSAARKDISHFILEVTDGAAGDDFTDFSINGHHTSYQDHIEGPRHWGHNPGNPGYPATIDIYGIKFDTGGSTVTYSFTTANDPVWGNFYVKSGKDKGQWIYAYNNALAIESFNSNNKIDFIVRPDGGSNPPIVPEPVSYLLFIVGGAVLACRVYIKRRD